jgi:hypothetical protein
MKSHTFAFLARVSCAALLAASIPSRAANLAVTPIFPAYGQEVSVELDDVGSAPFLPATRFWRDGANITVDLEHVAGGYFGVRMDFAYAPITIGELPPGNYAIRARLFDIGNLDAAPRVFTQALTVAAPDAPGVYAVPRAPDAYQPVEVVVRADAPIDASSLKATLAEGAIRVDFEFATDAPAAPSFATVKIAGLAPGSYRVDAFGTDRRLANGERRFSGSFRVGATATAVEYYAEGLDHYFVSAWADEVALLDANPAAGFKRTGQRFKAWLRASDAPGYAVPVCRFYASEPNSHFYTADATDCQFLKSLEQKARAEALAKGQAFVGWQFEAIAFYALAPEDGQCPAGTRPVYRAYNNRFAQNDSNHRFTVTEQMRVAMMMTWADEGVAFCSPA